MANDTKKTKEPSAKDSSANAVLTRPKNPSADIPATRPKNPPANLLPAEGYVLEVDGILKSEYATSDEASKAGLELKKKFAHIQVNVYDAKNRTRTLIELPD